jgi:hypothetical protein
MNMPANISVMVSAVPPQMVGFLWDRVEPIIQRVIDRAPRDLDMGKTYDHLINGRHLLVIITRGTEIVAACTMDVKTTDTGEKVLYLPIVGGDDLESWVEPFLEVAKGVARDYGCTRIRGTGRAGWARKLKKHGWIPTFQTVECEV